MADPSSSDPYSSDAVYTGFTDSQTAQPPASAVVVTGAGGGTYDPSVSTAAVSGAGGAQQGDYSSSSGGHQADQSGSNALATANVQQANAQQTGTGSIYQSTGYDSSASSSGSGMTYGLNQSQAIAAATAALPFAAPNWFQNADDSAKASYLSVLHSPLSIHDAAAQFLGITGPGGVPSVAAGPGTQVAGAIVPTPPVQGAPDQWTDPLGTKGLNPYGGLILPQPSPAAAAAAASGGPAVPASPAVPVTQPSDPSQMGAGTSFGAGSDTNPYPPGSAGATAWDVAHGLAQTPAAAGAAFNAAGDAVNAGLDWAWNAAKGAWEAAKRPGQAAPPILQGISRGKPDPAFIHPASSSERAGVVHTPMRVADNAGIKTEATVATKTAPDVYPNASPDTRVQPTVYAPEDKTVSGEVLHGLPPGVTSDIPGVPTAVPTVAVTSDVAPAAVAPASKDFTEASAPPTWTQAQMNEAGGYGAAPYGQPMPGGNTLTAAQTYEPGNTGTLPPASLPSGAAVPVPAQMGPEAPASPKEATPASGADGNYAKMRQLYLGSGYTNKTMHSMVTSAQGALKQAGYDVKTDGKYGMATLNAVKEFQKANGLQADGILGPQTWAALSGQTVQSKTSDQASAGNPLGGQQVAMNPGGALYSAVPPQGQPYGFRGHTSSGTPVQPPEQQYYPDQLDQLNPPPEKKRKQSAVT